ncbi:MAG: hypothetical protein ABI112_07735, partial [Terracoccus sp.]
MRAFADEGAVPAQRQDGWKDLVYWLVLVLPGALEAVGVRRPAALTVGYAMTSGDESATVVEVALMAGTVVPASGSRTWGRRRRVDVAGVE